MAACIESGGTKLTKGDLALAKICGQWPVITKTDSDCYLVKLIHFGFDGDILLRRMGGISDTCYIARGTIGF